MKNDKKTVIFDLYGTLAIIEKRKKISTRTDLQFQLQIQHLIQMLKVKYPI